jgi:magnesium transporter
MNQRCRKIKPQEAESSDKAFGGKGNSMKKRKLYAKKRHVATIGKAPGTLHEKPGAHETKIRLLSYGPEDLEELHSATMKDLQNLWKKRTVLWVDIEGLADIKLLSEIANLFQIHPLAMEDIVNIQERPKIESFQEHLFVVLRMFAEADVFESEQLAICLGEKVVVTFQERPGDCLESVRERIRKNVGRIRRNGGDYLTYALMDSVIDNYFPLIEKTGDSLEYIEQKVMEPSDPSLLEDIHVVKHKLIYLRRTIWPLRDAIHKLMRDDSELITDATKTYLRDCSDHTIQIVEILESYREMTSALMDLYLSGLSNRMNEIMQVLTVVSTTFIPLTFIAGLYGMNFNPEKSPFNMPELNWYWGYPFCLLLMFIAGIILLSLFWRAGWLKFAPRHNASKVVDE